MSGPSSQWTGAGCTVEAAPEVTLKLSVVQKRCSDQPTRSSDRNSVTFLRT